MYSLILMTAMSGAPEAPQFNGFFRNLFTGCRGESCYGCYGSGVSRSVGCYGSGPGFGSRLRAFFNRGSCYGSCYGTSYACYGSSYSCYGASYSCGGGYGLPPATDGFGAPPAGDGLAPYAPPAPAVPGSAYLPTDGGPGCCGDGYTLGTPARVADPFAAPFSTAPPAPMPAGPPASVPEDRNARRVALAAPTDDKARGTVVVKLPADARLYAEGRPLSQNSGERTFVTPPLPGGRDYTYSFRAEYVRDGETISQSKRVAVRPGQSATVEFADLTLAKTGAKPDPVPLTRPAAAKAEPVSKPGNPFVGGPAPAAVERARITVKLPPGATLYVDGRKNDRTELVREFSTPALKPGQEYAYLMKAEVTRDGRPESQLTKVTFRAGEIVTVDFTAAPAK